MMANGAPLVGLSILLVILTTPMCSAQDGNLLANGDFDDAGAGLAAGWRLQMDLGQAEAVRKAVAGADGGPCVEVTVTAKGQYDLRPTTGLVPIDPDAAYLLTCGVKASNVAAESHSAELQWFGDQGFMSRDTAAVTVANVWARIAVGPVRPPEGAARVIVLLRCYAPGTYAFDTVGFWEVQDMPPNILRNPGFESDADGDGVPDAWEPYGAGTSVEGQVAKTSARIDGDAEGARPRGWRQIAVSVTPAMRYELSPATRADEFGRELRMAIEWTRAGEVIRTDELTDQTWNDWQRKTLRTVAPADAEHANVLLEQIGPGTVWFDDVALSDSGRIAEIELALEKPNARGLIAIGVDGKVLEVVCEMSSDEDDLALHLLLIDANGAVLAQETPDWRAGPTRWTPDIGELGPGAYQVIAQAARRGETPAVVARAEVSFDIVPRDAPGIHFRDDHIALVGGNPWFPIGVTSFSPSSPEAQRIAQAGFNLLVTGGFTNGEQEQVQAALSRADELGVHLIEWNNGHVYDKLTEEQMRQRFADSAANVAGHPRFLGWLCDEALWNGVPLAQVRSGYLAARAAAPSLIFWQNQAPRNTVEDLARYCQWADVTGMDIYPVEGSGHSDLPNKTLSVVGDEIDKQAQTVDGRKPVWAILQGFGWGAWEKDEAKHKRAPTWAETRFMAYDAVMHGATGIIYWGANCEDQEAHIWDSLRRLAGELAQLTPALVAEDPVEIKALANVPVIASVRTVANKAWIIAVNESDQTLKASLSGLPGLTKLERFAEDGEPLDVENGTLLDEFGPWGVHVYREP